MATEGFPQWVRTWRERRNYSQDQLAKRIERLTGSFTRDRMFDLEHGQPRSPDPDLVTAVARALDRPITEALEALGYELPHETIDADRINPRMAAALDAVPYDVQEEIAELIPTVVNIATRISDPDRRRLRVAEPKAKYTPANSET